MFVYIFEVLIPSFCVKKNFGSCGTLVSSNTKRTSLLSHLAAVRSMNKMLHPLLALMRQESVGNTVELFRVDLSLSAWLSIHTFSGTFQNLGHFCVPHTRTQNTENILHNPGQYRRNRRRGGKNSFLDIFSLCVSETEENSRGAMQNE